ncbi:LAMI_0G04588g1_1 [Lachancea mirantina]|uniref:LAMI_0G04588g1_1 n=1 Tax=Lachancea mirantina TaxID=1230905 RepID=A0A1G4K8I7_9SACH|nr:LAMI_0G04588g1_1 [Lachancea mirantina]
MPLILLTGFPACGKTTQARQLVSALQDKISQEPALSKYSVVYHSDETLGIRHDEYRTSQDERRLRSKILSAVKRDLSRTRIVVVDSLNYIKGFRYQLHCEVKNVATTYCLVHVMCAGETLARWNKSGDVSPTGDADHPETAGVPWDEDLLAQLIQRYEEPNSQTRWDSPLIPVLAPEDSLFALREQVFRVIFPQLYRDGNDRETLRLLNAIKPNNSTILRPASAVNSVQMLDAETSAVVKKIAAALQINVVSGPTRVFVSETTDVNDPNCVFVELPAEGASVAQLQRIRRQFVALNRLRSIERNRVVCLFAEYLNKNLREL